MTTLQVHETAAVVGLDGSLRVNGLPFGVGERVRVMVLADPAAKPRRHTAEEIERSRNLRRGLRGSVTAYDDPFSPAVPIEDWDVLRDDQP